MSKPISSFFTTTASKKEEKVTVTETTEIEENEAQKPTAKKRKVIETEEHEESVQVEQEVIPAAKKARAEANKAIAKAKLEAKKTKTKTVQETKESITEATESKVTDLDWDHLESSIHPSWQKHLSAEFKKPYWNKLKQRLKQEFDNGVQIFPPFRLIFRALQLCPFDEVKAVIIGQDPYHDNGQAEGLCFSVPEGKAIPPSLRNIYKELASDIPGFKIPQHGHLLKWAQQGVLLLNITLTVQAHKANSHESFGWSEFTSAVVNALNRDRSGLVFLLWGNHAKKKASSIDKKKHHSLQAGHPSPLSQKTFFGCKHFSKCNALLQAQGQTPIDWSL